MIFAPLNYCINYFGKTWWAPLIVKDFGSFLETNESVLDIGAGGGWVGELIAEKKNAKVTLLDVEDFNRSSLPITLYDGEHIPFPDNSFDTSLLLFVLHHCKNPLAVLKEAIRVTKKRIIIHEDTFASSFEWALACTNDFISNSPFFITNPFKMNMPYNYREVENWEKAFESLGLKVRFKKITKHLITKHVLFILDK